MCLAIVVVQYHISLHVRDSLNESLIIMIIIIIKNLHVT